MKSTQLKAAKIAGFMFLFSLIIPLFNWTFILSKFIVEDNVIATAKKIMANEIQFRMGISIELLMSIALVVIALALYVLLKPVNRNLALLALSLKLVEATLMAGNVLIPLIALQALNVEADQAIFSSEQLLFPIGVIFNSHTAITAVPMVFLGLDMMLFSYLFLKSKYVPAWLAVFGIISFLLVFSHAIMFIITPGYAVKPIYQIIFWVPSGLFEIIIGIWLLTKGLKKVKQIEEISFEK